jgi:hypothetical protein
MDPAQASNPGTFELAKFIVEVVLIGGVGGLGGFIWKVVTDLRNDAREERKQRLEEVKLQTDMIERGLDRAAAELKPAIDNLATIAIEVANKYYRPVLDSMCGVDLYAETYGIIEQTISAAKEKIRTGKASGDIPAIVREALERYPETKDLLQAMEEARPSCADYLFSELETLHRNIVALVSSGYIWELEKDVGRQDLIKFYNWRYASGMSALLKSRSPEELSAFLASWKAGEFDPLRRLKDKVPWEAFLSHYYGKLRHAARDSYNPPV